MNRVLCLGRTSRTLLAFAAALVLCVPPGVAGELIRIAQPHSAPVQATVHKSCCSATRNHEACAPEKAVVKEVVRTSCCHRSDTTKLPVKSCCGGMGGCGCSCCPTMLIAVVPAGPFEWSSPVLEQACLHPSFVLSSRRDVPPTPPPNVA